MTTAASASRRPPASSEQRARSVSPVARRSRSATTPSDPQPSDARPRGTVANAARRHVAAGTVLDRLSSPRTATESTRNGNKFRPFTGLSPSPWSSPRGTPKSDTAGGSRSGMPPSHLHLCPPEQQTGLVANSIETFRLHKVDGKRSPRARSCSPSQEAARVLDESTRSLIQALEDSWNAPEVERQRPARSSAALKAVRVPARLDAEKRRIVRKCRTSVRGRRVVTAAAAQNAATEHVSRASAAAASPGPSPELLESKRCIESLLAKLTNINRQKR